MKNFLFSLLSISFVHGFLRPFHPQNYVIKSDPYKYPLSRDYYERYIRRLNSRNSTIQTNEILQQHEEKKNNATYRIIINKNMFNSISSQLFPSDEDQEDGDNYNDLDDFYKKPRNSGKKGKKSENFEVITNLDTNFTCVGGYDNIKSELAQCVDLLKNFTKYSKFNVRVPKGLIFEGPPGN